MILTGADLIRRTRRLIDDTETPYYLEDEDLFAYLNEAQRDLAREGLLLHDVDEVTTVANTRWLVSGGVLVDVQRAWLVDGTSKYPLDIWNAQEAAMRTVQTNDYGLVSRVQHDRKDRPTALIFGRRTGYYEFSPTPDDAYTIEIERTYVPEDTILDDLDEPVLEERWHMYLPFGAAAHAFAGTEDEHFDQRRLAQVKAKWQEGLDSAHYEGRVVSRAAGYTEFKSEVW